MNDIHPSVELLQQLIRLPSVSPMGGDVPADSEIVGERRVSEFLTVWGNCQDIDTVRQNVAPSRDNVVFMLPGTRPGVLLWEVHQDTVPVDGMTIDPFAGELHDGRVFGRGACDVKGGMAAMLSALSALRRSARTSDGEDNAVAPGGREHCTVLLACTVDEEQGGAGAFALPELWKSGAIPTPDAAVIAEPTLLNVVVAHKGVTRWRCETQGVAAHSSNPSAGDSAIERMAEVVLALRQYQTGILGACPPHALLGRPTLSVGTIRGGAGVNLVPDQCEVEIDRRLLPEETPQAAQQQVRDYLASRGLESRVIHHAPYLEASGLSDRDNQGLAGQLAAAAKATGAEANLLGVPFGTDAARLASHVPCVVFGPGDITQAHTVDEWIATDQLPPAVDILLELARSFAPGSVS